MEFASDENHGRVRERTTAIVGSRGSIPIALWTPSEGQMIRHLVLVGHGAGGHKRQDYVTALARGLVRRYDFGVVAMDGPVHGERRTDFSINPNESALPFLEFVQVWSNDETLTNNMVDDWHSCLDQVLAADEFSNVANVGYWGLSMGTILGLPFVASEPRIRACVLGLMGLTGPTRDRIATDALSLVIPTMFLVQWDDELFNRDDAFALFDRLGASDKQLIATPGRHSEVTNENFHRSGEFLADRLGKAENATK
jgi:pimeloyl-ACP methyl ester carboxylesterase